MSRQRKAERVVRDCTHPQANHQHGTLVAYNKDRCRCGACTDAMSQQRTKHNHTGERLVSAQAARTHIESAISLGLSVSALSKLSGVSRTGIDRLRSGKSSKIQPANERALLGVDVMELIESAFSKCSSSEHTGCDFCPRRDAF